MPSYDNWLNLAIFGIKASIIKLIFTTIPVIVFYLLAEGATDPGESTAQLLGLLLSGGLFSEYLSDLWYSRTG
ncbi:DUF4013 domain-containing protein [Natribaculum luteum]|uniref:DUF4013 domain-containing protein n=1 Tax=Natribaculum luteum TaxID=1586232 RepID=A0ABD5P1J2_9EURY